MQVIPKWKLTYWFADEPQGAPMRKAVLFLSDRHLSNILREAANIDFEERYIVGVDVEVEPPLGVSHG